MQNNDKDILVISGGGIKGIAILGAISKLEELKKIEKITTFAGTSIGGIIGCMISIGYTAIELYDTIIEYNLENIKNIDLNNIFGNYCIDNGEKLEIFIKELLKKKNIDPMITLKELFIKTNKRIILTTMCINNPKKPIYLWYGNYPKLPLITGLRMTSALVPYYSFITYENNIYGDGGYIDNYPMKIFKNKLDKVLGLYIIENVNEINTTEVTSTLMKYMGRLVDCFRYGINLNCLKGFEKYTIKINLESINIIDYNIDNNKKKILFDKGYAAVTTYFDLITNVEEVQ